MTSIVKNSADVPLGHEHFRLRIEGFGVGTWDLDLATREIEWSEAAGNLLGVKLVLTEIIALIDLAKEPELALRTRLIMTYALCSFANVASVGIISSGFGVLMPERRQEINGMVWKALVAGFLATIMTGALIGALPGGLFGV